MYFPEPLRANVDGESGLFWMSPDEALVMVPHAEVHDALDRIRAALAGTHFLAENLSDARALFPRRGGGGARGDRQVRAGGPARGRLRARRLPAARGWGQVAAAFWLGHDGAFGVICFASVGDYMAELLETSAARGPVGHLSGA